MIEHYNKLAYYTLALKDENFIHQHIVDAYTAEHATADTKAISLIFALVGLYLQAEKNYTGKQVQQFHTLMSNHKIDWPNILLLPNNRGEITIEHVLNKSEGEQRNQMITNWCYSVWDAYAEHHLLIINITTHYEQLQ